MSKPIVKTKDLCGAPGRQCNEKSGYIVMARCEHLRNHLRNCAKFDVSLRRASAFSVAPEPLKCDACIATRDGSKA